MKLQPEFSAAGCNRSPESLAWARHGLLAYGSDRVVRLYDPQADREVASLLGHAGEVRCLAWSPEQVLNGRLLLSGACDGVVRAWAPGNDGAWTCVSSLRPSDEASLGALSSLACHLVPEEGVLLVVACAAEQAVACWTVAAGAGEIGAEWEHATYETFHAGKPLAHSVALCGGCSPASASWTLAALGGVDGHVHVYTRAPGGSFSLAARLEGHADWVRSLAWAPDGASGLRLASAGQDRYVRIWSFSTGDKTASAAGLGAEAMITRFAPKPRVTLDPGTTLIVNLETLLVGHEDWVMSVAWRPASEQSNGEDAGPCLLSASMDRSMMLWAPCGGGLWLSQSALGDAGANHLGYYTGCWSGDGEAVATHGYTGSLHIWRRAGDDRGRGASWLPAPAPSGHSAAVVDLAWTEDDCLLSVSDDQTARCWARCEAAGKREEEEDLVRVEERGPSSGPLWREVARPQVHGHNFFGVAVLPRPGGANAPRTYASCSEEKVIRVFSAPSAFEASLAALRGAQSITADSTDLGDEAPALGAALPALGLSNKAVYASEAAAPASGASVGKESYAEGPDMAPAAAPRPITSPPLEEFLAQSTLWPEVRKLYGHGNEVACLAGDPRGRYLASAAFSSGSDAGTAAIWFWDVARGWAPAGRCVGHTLTVTRLSFSPDGRFLASVARDRTLALWRRRENADDAESALASGPPLAPASPPFELVARVKAASRVLYDVSWREDGRALATAARDGSVTLWGAGDEGLTRWRDVVGKQASPARSVAFGPALAVGLEDGTILVAPVPSEGEGEAAGEASIEKLSAHAGAVRRLLWRRLSDGTVLLASCGDDRAVRLWRARDAERLAQAST